MAPERSGGEDDTEALVRNVVDQLVDLGLEFAADESLSPLSDLAQIRMREIKDLLEGLSPEDQARAHALAEEELAQESTESRRIQANQPEARAWRAVMRLEESVGDEKFSADQIDAAVNFQAELTDRLTEDPEIKAQYEELCRSLGIDPSDRDELWEKSRSIIQVTKEKEE